MIIVFDYCLSETFIPRQSLRGNWRELCVCNVWENIGAMNVLTHMLKRVRIFRQHTYSDQPFWSTWDGMMNTSGFINALGVVLNYLRGGKEDG
jgi:hypothetical protein